MKAMACKEEQFVTDAKGNRVGVLLDVKTYDRLREAEEELSDIRAYDRARAKVHAEVKAGQAVSLTEYRMKRNVRRR
jgi:PHD/YefM family antitoxin component YafN of YafNO toxin-antitoxin module